MPAVVISLETDNDGEYDDMSGQGAGQYKMQVGIALIMCLEGLDPHQITTTYWIIPINLMSNKDEWWEALAAPLICTRPDRDTRRRQLSQNELYPVKIRFNISHMLYQLCEWEMSRDMYLY